MRERGAIWRWKIRDAPYQFADTNSVSQDCQGFIPAVRAKQRADTVRTGAFLLPDMTLANVVNSNAMEYVVKEADEVLIEAGYGGIITGAECFERYGFQPLDAPSLKFSVSS